MCVCVDPSASSQLHRLKLLITPHAAPSSSTPGCFLAARALCIVLIGTWRQLQMFGLQRGLPALGTLPDGGEHSQGGVRISNNTEPCRRTQTLPRLSCSVQS